MPELTPQEAKKLGLRNYGSQTNIPSEHFVKIYTNNVGVSATNWDTSLIFGEIMGLDQDGEPVVEQKVKVNMTREFMKALSNLLTANVKAFEEKYGEISFDRLLAVTEGLEKTNAKKVVAKKPVAKKAAPVKKKG
ncbi:MAG: DUF3467 domain-containing protein [Pyrinomonadaceae bacterium]